MRFCFFQIDLTQTLFYQKFLKKQKDWFYSKLWVKMARAIYFLWLLVRSHHLGKKEHPDGLTRDRSWKVLRTKSILGKTLPPCISQKKKPAKRKHNWEYCMKWAIKLVAELLARPVFLLVSSLVRKLMSSAPLRICLPQLQDLRRS